MPAMVIEVAMMFSFSTGVTMYRGKMTMDDVRLTSDRLQTQHGVPSAGILLSSH